MAGTGGLLAWKLGHQPLQLLDQTTDRPPLSAWEPGRINEHESMMSSAPLVSLLGKRYEIPDVLGDYSSAIRLGLCEDRRIRERAKLLSLGDRNGVMAAPAKLLRHRGWIHLIDEEPQASAACARSQASRKRSASLRLTSIRPSISSRKSP